MFSESVSNIRCCFSGGQHPRVRNQGVEWEEHHSLPLAKFLLHVEPTITEQTFLTSQNIDSQPLSLAPQGLVQLVHKHSSYYPWDGVYIWAHEYGLPLIKVGLITTTAECLLCKPQRQTLSPVGTPSLKETKQPLSGNLIIWHPSHPRRRSGLS